MKYIVAGIGGQGILFATKVLGHIALGKGLPVIGSEVHGMSQRGGSVISHFKIGDYQSPLIASGDADIFLAFDQSEALRNYHFLREGGQAVINVERPADLAHPRLQDYFSQRHITVHALDGLGLIREHLGGKFLFLNVLILGALCGAGLGNFSRDEMRQAVGELAPARFREENLKGFDLGYGALAK